MKSYILMIESLGMNGRISLVKENSEIDFYCFEKGNNKKDSILELIDVLIKRNKIKKNEISKFYYLSGNGSATGTRVFGAMAMGLKKALNIKIENIEMHEILKTFKKELGLSRLVYYTAAGKLRWFFFDDDSVKEGSFDEKEIQCLEKSIASFSRIVRSKDGTSYIIYLTDKYFDFERESRSAQSAAANQIMPISNLLFEYLKIARLITI